MNMMFSKFEGICDYEGINFDAKNQRVHCLAHIINLAAQNILKSLKEEAPNNEIEILEENNSANTMGVISKVIKALYLYYIKLILIIIINCIFIASKIGNKNSCISSKA